MACSRILTSLALCLGPVVGLVGCAKQDPEADFRPIQIRWIAEPGQDESQLENKDNCVIFITGRLMGEEPVVKSKAGLLGYNVFYGANGENPEILEFKGFCDDSSLENSPECKWIATCDKDLNVVVKFNNGD
ncbi:MAG: hypothetical protein MJZ26_03030 [Fibrobacter sp.]|nr:hypothetical protein [Fibrobacter sp.]